MFIYAHAGLQISINLHFEGKKNFLSTISVLTNLQFYIHITPQLHCP